MKSIANYGRSMRARALKGLKNGFLVRSGALAAVPLALALAGCAAPSGSSGQATLPHYRCEQGIDFSVNFVDDSAVLNGSGGQDVLFRTAGGQGDMQRFYSNPRMKAEFGLGASGREAILRYPLLPLVVRCARDSG